MVSPIGVRSVDSFWEEHVEGNGCFSPALFLNASGSVLPPPSQGMEERIVELKEEADLDMSPKRGRSDDATSARVESAARGVLHSEGVESMDDSPLRESARSLFDREDLSSTAGAGSKRTREGGEQKGKKEVRWSEEEDSFLLAHCDEMTRKELRVELNTRYGNDRTLAAVRRRCCILRASDDSPKRFCWRKGEIDLLRANRRMPLQELARLLHEHTGIFRSKNAILIKSQQLGISRAALKEWSKAEKELFIQLLKENPLRSLQDVETRLFAISGIHRSQQALCLKAHEWGIARSLRKKWSEAEKIRLKKCLDDGLSFDEIYKREIFPGRSIDSLRSGARNL